MVRKHSCETYRYPNGMLATCCIPWDEEYHLMEDVFRNALRSILEHTPHIYLFGTAGEGYALTREQYAEIVTVFADEMGRAQADPMVGVIELSLGEIMYRINMALEMGVTAFQISLPSWDTLTEKETEQFFDTVLSGFPQARFIHYHVGRSGRLISPREYENLAGKYPNLVGAKITTCTTRSIEELMGLHLPLRFFFTSPGYAYASMFGSCGLLIAIASCNWKRARQYFDAGQSGDRATLLRLQSELGAMTNVLMQAVGSSGHIDGAYDKIFLKLHDPKFPLRLLPPYDYPSDTSFEQFRNALLKRFPEWIQG